MLAELRPVVITTCVNYWDFLRVTLPYTLAFASKVYIVTSMTDIVTHVTDTINKFEFEFQKNVEIIRTPAFSAHGKVFNKSAAIHEAQLKVHAAHPDQWILLLDADVIATPDLCHDVFCKLTLYSVCRLDFETPADFAADRGTPYHTPGAGYFQLYFDKSKVYPESSEDASECDMEFYRSFSRHHILGGSVSHLGIHTVNWKGRKSVAWA